MLRRGYDLECGFEVLLKPSKFLHKNLRNIHAYQNLQSLRKIITSIQKTLVWLVTEKLSLKRKKQSALPF